MVKLSIQDSEGRTTVVPLADGELDIGRSDSNAICLTDRNVSRHHAKLTVQGSRVWIENLQASWGTKRNKLLIHEKTELAEGDALQIGDYTLEIESEGGAARDTALRDEANARTATKGGDSATAMISLAEIQADGPTSPSTAIPEASQPRLVVESENLRGLEVRITKTPIVLGRVRENADLVLDHRSISKEHARLTRLANGSWQILDLGSANGIKVNGEPYSKCDVQSGDRIELGHVTMRFLASGAPTPSLEDVGNPKRSKLPLALAVGAAAALFSIAVVVALTGGKKGDAAGNDALAAAKPAAIAPEAVIPPEEAADAAAPVSADVEAAEAPPAPKVAETAVGGVADALAKADALRKSGAYDEALQVLRDADKTSQNNAQISLRIRQVEAEKKWQAKLNQAESLLAKDPAAALERAAEAKTHLAVDDPLAATAEKIIDAAKAGLADKHKAGKAEAKTKPETPTAVKPEPEVKPVTKPEPAAEVKAAPAAKSGKDLYEEGRSAQMDGKTDAAIALYLQATKAGFGKAHKQLALLYQARNDKAGCAKNAKAYLEKNPSAGDADAMQQLLDKCSN